MAQYIQSAEKKKKQKLTTKDTLCDMVIIQNWRENKEQKGVHHHWTVFIRNIKGTSLSRKEKVITRNKKIFEGENLNGKGKHTEIVKASGSTTYKLVWGLQDKSSKIN